MKMATQYWINRGVRGKKQFVAFHGAYHGDTLGAMSVSDLDSGMHDAFRDLRRSGCDRNRDDCQRDLGCR